MYDLICIGASWGGLQAVGRVLSDLPPELELPQPATATLVAASAAIPIATRFIQFD